MIGHIVLQFNSRGGGGGVSHSIFADILAEFDRTLHVWKYNM